MATLSPLGAVDTVLDPGLTVNNDFDGPLIITTPPVPAPLVSPLFHPPPPPLAVLDPGASDPEPLLPPGPPTPLLPPVPPAALFPAPPPPAE